MKISLQRQASIVSLRIIKSRSAITSIMRRVKDNNPRVRGTAVHALGDLRADKAISLIMTALKDKDR